MLRKNVLTKHIDDCEYVLIVTFCLRKPLSTSPDSMLPKYVSSPSKTLVEIMYFVEQIMKEAKALSSVTWDFSAFLALN